MRIDEMTSAELAEYYEGLGRKNAMWYQQTGESRYDNKAGRYEKIADAFRAKAASEREYQSDIRKRMANMKGVVDRLSPDKLYSFDEVAKLLREAVWW